jgi:hypothetical protein
MQGQHLCHRCVDKRIQNGSNNLCVTRTCQALPALSLGDLVLDGPYLLPLLMYSMTSYKASRVIEIPTTIMTEPHPETWSGGASKACNHSTDAPKSEHFHDVPSKVNMHGEYVSQHGRIGCAKNHRIWYME